MRSFISGIIFTLVVAVLGAIFVLWKGYVEFRADLAPSWLETKFAMAAVDASTERHAAEAKNPVAPTEENLLAGARVFRDHCAGCHGDPSHSDSNFGRSFYPPVPQFFKEAPDMPENQNLYIIQHGIRWTGMPAWNSTLSQQEMWEVVTFLSHIEKLPPAVEQELRKPPLP